jgi:hypothetical protein
MKAIAFGNRLARDIDEKSFIDLTADVRLEILDAINGGLQTMHALAPAVSKITSGSIFIEAPITVDLTVTNGSVEVSGYPFTGDQFYRTIRIDGDDIDNQIAGTTTLLHPYTGASGTVSATIYADGVAIVEPYEEMVGDPRILETGRDLRHHKTHLPTWNRKQVTEPRYYWLEANARNRNSLAPAVLRFDCLPDRAYRLESQFSLAPAKVSFSDLLAPGVDIPLRAELIEVYLLPIARGIFTSCRLWRDPATKSQVRADAEAAEAKYKELTPTTLATPSNHVGTPDGF